MWHVSAKGKGPMGVVDIAADKARSQPSSLGGGSTGAVVPEASRRPEPPPAADVPDQLSDDGAMMARFVRDYLELLDHRIEQVRRHLDLRNYMSAHVSLLSLESTSVMVGAAGLAAAAGRLRDAVEHGDRDAMPDLTAAVVVEAARARRELPAPT